MSGTTPSPDPAARGEQLRRAVEQAPVAIALFDRHMRYLAASRRYREVYRLPDEDLTGRSHYEVFPEIPERWREVHARCLAGSAERQEEDPFVRADGSVDYVSWEIRPWRDGEGAVGGVVLVSEVVTERRRAERALLRSRETFRELADNSPDPISRFDPAARYLYVNSAGAGCLGLAAEQIVGRRIDELGPIPPDLAAAWVSRVEQVLATGRPLDLEEVFPTVAGPRCFHTRVVPERAPDGSVSSVLAVSRETTGRRAAEEALRRSEEQLRQAQRLESVGRLAGGIAHDFNNVLTVILSCADSLEEGLAAGAPASADEVREIQEAARRARDLTRQLLAFARKQVISPVVLDLGALAERSGALLRRVLREDVALVLRCAPGCAVLCDQGQLEQALLNLAANARDAMPGGGTLTIEVLPAGADPRHLALPGRWISLVVRDTGHGMSPEVQERAFEPFFTTKGQGEGTGLGLATVHGFVSQSGGHVHLESRPGEGATFTLCFPAASATEVAAPPQRVERGPRDAGGETILLVEDDPLVRRVTTRLLEGAGYRVVAAADGPAALEVAAREPVDGVVSDVVMPGMSGKVLAERLRSAGLAAPVLFVSGHPEDVIARNGLLDPGVRFLAKPFEAAALLARVRELLDAGRAPRQ